VGRKGGGARGGGGGGGGGSNRVTRLAGVRSGAPPFYGFSLGIDPDARECPRRRQRPPLPWGEVKKKKNPRVHTIISYILL